MGGLGDFRIKTWPEQAFEELVDELRRIQAALPDEKEIGIVANGADRPIHVESLRWTGQLIVFDGSDSDGHDATLVQHYSQLSVQIIALDKLESTARRIGF